LPTVMQSPPISFLQDHSAGVRRQESGVSGKRFLYFLLAVVKKSVDRSVLTKMTSHGLPVKM
jgi:hypothetical protein